MKAAPFLMLGLILVTLAGCVGAGPNIGMRANCYDDRNVPQADTPPPAFFFFCRQSP